MNNQESRDVAKKLPSDAAVVFYLKLVHKIYFRGNEKNTATV